MMACVRIPHFAAELEQRDNPMLSGNPLVLIESWRKTERVFDVSEEGSKVGIGPGMALRQAQALCPQGRFMMARHAVYEQAFDALLDTLGSMSPVIEPGEAHPAVIVYLDLTDQENREGVEVAQAIGRAIRQALHLVPAMGLAREKFTAYAAALAVEPNGALIVAPDGGRRFLSPFPVGVLPLDEEMNHRLGLLGIRTLGQLAALPQDAIQAQFGKTGLFFHKLARAQDQRRLISRPAPRVEQVSRQFDDPVNDLIVLKNIVRDAVADLTECLKAKGLMGQELHLALQLEDGTTLERELTMRRPSVDVERLSRAVMDLIASASLHAGVVDITISQRNLMPLVGRQLDLFAHGVGQEDRLRDVLEDLAKRYGVGCFYRVSLTDGEAPVLELRFHFTPMDDL